MPSLASIRKPVFRRDVLIDGFDLGLGVHVGTALGFAPLGGTIRILAYRGCRLKWWVDVI